MKKIKNGFAVLALALGLTTAFAFTSPKSVLFSPTYNGSGQITGWQQVAGSYHCNLNPNRICTATFKNDDPSQQMLSSTKGNFTQP